MQEAEYQTIFIVYSIGTTNNVQIIKRGEYLPMSTCKSNFFFLMKVDILWKEKQDFYQHTNKLNICLDRWTNWQHSIDWISVYTLTEIYNLKMRHSISALVKVNYLYSKVLKRWKEIHVHMERTVLLLCDNKDHCYSHSNPLHPHSIY